MMMTMDQSSSVLGDIGVYLSDPFILNQSTSSPLSTDPDVDWSVFENAERYLLRDDSAWITRLSKDFWWNLERISEMIISDMMPAQQTLNNNGTINRSSLPTPKSQQQFMQPVATPTKLFPQQHAPTNSTAAVPPPPPPSIQYTGVPARKIVGQRSQIPMNNSYRNNSMFHNGFTSSPPSSSSSIIVRPRNNNFNSNINIPDKSNFFQAFSSMSIVDDNHDQDIEYNPFQSKISFNNHMWSSHSQQPIPWQ